MGFNLHIILQLNNMAVADTIMFCLRNLYPMHFEVILKLLFITMA